MRKQYLLLKETIDLKKGAILEECCDNGDQDYVSIKPEFQQKPDDSAPTIERYTVENNPKWFEPLEIIRIPKSKMEKFTQFLNKLK